MELRFSYIDYSIFGSMLFISISIGIYFGFFAKRKQDNTMEYLMGSKQLKTIPVAMSIISCHTSAITMMGVPAEIYIYGTQYWAVCVSGIFVTLAMVHIYLPVFYELQATSMFTYLEKRFDQRQKSFASGLFVFAQTLMLPLLIYAPAMAFSQVSGVSIHVITPVTCIICIFYTTIGGIRAVVWTDAIQFGSMVGGVVVVCWLGVNSVGGFSKLFEINEEGGRIIWFNMDPDPTSRSTFWSYVIGVSILWLSNVGVTPECVQRFLTVPSYTESKKILWMFGFGHVSLKMIALLSGILIYARYQTCDPFITGKIEKHDQIFAYYVMDMAKSVPGLPGLFIAGIFAAALSSLSSSLNALSGTIYTDFLKPKFPNATEKTSSNILKLLVVVIGCYATGMVFVVERLGNILSLAFSLIGVTSGTILGMFSFGILFPKANRHGVFWGSLCSIATVVTLGAGAQAAILFKQLKYQSLSFRTDGCDDDGYETWMNRTGFMGSLNSTTHILNEYHDNSAVPWFFRIGFMYYSIFGVSTIFLVGYPISILTGGCDNLDDRLLAPFVRRWYNAGLHKTKKPTLVEKEEEEQMKPLNNAHIINGIGKNIETKGEI